MTYDDAIRELKAQANPTNVAGMARFGISTRDALGVSVPALRRMARGIGTDHALAQKLWRSGIHEARLLAAFIDDPAEVTATQMDRWVRDFDSWDVCDLVCSDLFDKTRLAWDRAVRWSDRKEEYVKRAAFALMAALSVHDKRTTDNMFIALLPIIQRESTDERNFVRKAVNWALRQIGKRNVRLNREAIRTAGAIARMDSKAARWIASDALRELQSPAVKKRLAARAER